MKKIVFVLCLLSLCLACKKEEPLPDPQRQYHLLNFVDESGENVFSSGKLSTDDIYFKLTSEFNTYWEDLEKRKMRALEHFVGRENRRMLFKEALEANKYSILDPYGHFFFREMVRFFNIKEKEYRLNYIFGEGFYLNEKAVEYKTDTVALGHIYVHDIVLPDISSE